MKGLDTNVVLRLLLEDDPTQAARARAAVRRESSPECRVNRIVLCEVVWVLESAYKYRREQIGDAAQALLLSDDLALEQRDVVRSALYVFRTSRAEFSNCLLGMSNGLSGCERTLTFDRRAAELDEFELI